jgi:hypothetical protein
VTDTPALSATSLMVGMGITCAVDLINIVSQIPYKVKRRGRFGRGCLSLSGPALARCRLLPVSCFLLPQWGILKP